MFALVPPIQSASALAVFFVAFSFNPRSCSLQPLANSSTDDGAIDLPTSLLRHDLCHIALLDEDDGASPPFQAISVQTNSPLAFVFLPQSFLELLERHRRRSPPQSSSSFLPLFRCSIFELQHTPASSSHLLWPPPKPHDPPISSPSLLVAQNHHSTLPHRLHRRRDAAEASKPCFAGFFTARLRPVFSDEESP